MYIQYLAWIIEEYIFEDDVQHPSTIHIRAFVCTIKLDADGAVEVTSLFSVVEL